MRQFIFTYDRSESIMAVFLFYGYCGRARCKVSLFRLTVGKLWSCLCCLFGQKWLLFSYIAISTSFLSLKRKNASSGPGTS